jgi:hypothetical protein
VPAKPFFAIHLHISLFAVIPTKFIREKRKIEAVVR